MAVQELFPGTQVTIGPAIEDGFYYDFARAEPFTPEDLPKIEAKMHEIVREARPTRREVWPRDKAIQHFQDIGEKYKAELIAGIPANEDVSIYYHGDWHDLCRGPHFRTTADIGDAFKLTKIAGAYWRGNSKNAQLQRNCPAAWRDKKELDAYLERLAEAEKRDHRELGGELELFTFSPRCRRRPAAMDAQRHGDPPGTEIPGAQEERKDGYRRVATPHITKEALVYRSRHLPYYAEACMRRSISTANYYLRPMNCPYHHLIYGATAIPIANCRCGSPNMARITATRLQAACPA